MTPTRPAKTPKKKAMTVAGYIAAAPAASRAKLRELRACVRAVAPDATEGLKWGMPALTQGRILVTYAGFNHHVGFYPTPPVIKAFAKQLSGYVTAAGSVQFPLDKPLPLALIRKMTAYRLQELVDADGKWRT